MLLSFLKKIIIYVLLLMLTACSFMQPISTPAQTYVLTDPNSAANNVLPAQGKTLVVVVMPGVPWLDTPRMVYQLQPNAINYFAQHVWAAPPAQLLQPIVVHALQQTNQYHAVVAAPFAGSYDQRLEIRLLDMQQLFTQKPSAYQMTWQAQLINNNTQQIIAMRRFSTLVPAPADNPQGGVIAANQAVAQLLPQLVSFCQHYR